MLARCIYGIGIVLVAFALAACDGAPRDLTELGNLAYAKGEYKEAITAYVEAGVAKPESPFLYFNKAAALYQCERYDDASEAYEKAALRSKDLPFEALSQYNIGNCRFRQGQRQRDSDLKKALEYLEQSVQHYQKALELDPELADAAHNIEVTRLTMKVILDEIKKQQEQQEQQVGPPDQEQQDAQQKQEQDGQQKQEQQQAGQQEQGGQEAEQEEQESSQEDSAAKEAENQEDQQIALEESAHDVIDEEEQQREEQRPATGRFAPVDKDW